MRARQGLVLLTLLKCSLALSACLGPEPAVIADMNRAAQDMNAPALDSGSDVRDSAQDEGGDDLALDDLSEGDQGADAAREEDLPPAELGVLTGDCQQIDEELFEATPSLFRNELDFAQDGYDERDKERLTPGARRILEAGNAGGSSLLSEVFAFEVLARCESATLLETETTIDYKDEMGKITDLLVEIDGEQVGVSVVRALAFPFEQPYPEQEARRVLTDKLEGIALSSLNVEPRHAWVKQILSVMAYTAQHADQIEAVFSTLEPELRGDTILYLTVTEGEDRALYFND